MIGNLDSTSTWYILIIPLLTCRSIKASHACLSQSLVRHNAILLSYLIV
jgi:hypothetical protein